MTQLAIYSRKEAAQGGGPNFRCGLPAAASPLGVGWTNMRCLQPCLRPYPACFRAAPLETILVYVDLLPCSLRPVPALPALMPLFRMHLSSAVTLVILGASALSRGGGRSAARLPRKFCI